MAKIFIAAPVYDGKHRCFHAFYKNINMLETDMEKTIYIVDNSVDETYHQKLKETYSIDNIDWVNPKNKKSLKTIAQSYKKIQEKFLQSDCDYLYIQEEDITVPIDLLPHLQNYDKDIICCPYFTGIGEESFLLAFWFFENEEGKLEQRQLSWWDNFLLFDGKIKQVLQCGIGSVLIKRHVLEKVELGHFTEKEKADNSTHFHLQSYNKGMQTYIITDTIANHDNDDWSGIARNH